MSYSSIEVTNLTDLLNNEGRRYSGLNINFHHLPITNSSGGWNEIHYLYQGHTQFSIIYLNGEVNFIYKQGLMYINDVQVTLVVLNYVLTNQKDNIKQEFQRLLLSKGQPI